MMPDREYCGAHLTEGFLVGNESYPAIAGPYLLPE